MTAYLDVFVPAFGTLALGALLRRFLLRDDAVWAGIERLVFWALMPALLVSAIASVDLRALPLGRMALAIWLALAGGAALSLLLARAARADFPAATSVLQGGIRFNNLMGFALVGGLFGPAGTALGAVAISVIGLANIGGSILAGWLGKRYPRKYLLAGIYALRTLVAAWFILTPITPATVLIFSLAMGSLWLATVPLTSGLVAYIYGLRYMGTLYGFVFLSHQLGSFLGVWLGGKLYDLYGDYTLVWWVGVGVGAFSALIHLPVREAPARLPVAAAV